MLELLNQLDGFDSRGDVKVRLGMGLRSVHVVLVETFFVDLNNPSASLVTVTIVCICVCVLVLYTRCGYYLRAAFILLSALQLIFEEAIGSQIHSTP